MDFPELCVMYMYTDMLAKELCTQQIGFCILNEGQGSLKNKRMPKINVGYNVIFEYKRLCLFLSVYSTSALTLSEGLVDGVATLTQCGK